MSLTPLTTRALTQTTVESRSFLQGARALRLRAKESVYSTVALHGNELPSLGNTELSGLVGLVSGKDSAAVKLSGTSARLLGQRDLPELPIPGAKRFQQRLLSAVPHSGKLIIPQAGNMGEAKLLMQLLALISLKAVHHLFGQVPDQLIQGLYTLSLSREPELQLLDIGPASQMREEPTLLELTHIVSALRKKMFAFPEYFEKGNLQPHRTMTITALWHAQTIAEWGLLEEQIEEAALHTQLLELLKTLSYDAIAGLTNKIIARETLKLILIHERVKGSIPYLYAMLGSEDARMTAGDLPLQFANRLERVEYLSARISRQVNAVKEALSQNKDKTPKPSREYDLGRLHELAELSQSLLSLFQILNKYSLTTERTVISEVDVKILTRAIEKLHGRKIQPRHETTTALPEVVDDSPSNVIQIYTGDQRTVYYAAKANEILGSITDRNLDEWQVTGRFIIATALLSPRFTPAEKNLLIAEYEKSTLFFTGVDVLGSMQELASVFRSRHFTQEQVNLLRGLIPNLGSLAYDMRAQAAAELEL